MRNYVLHLVNVAHLGRKEHSSMVAQAAGLALLYFLFFGPLMGGLVKDWQENSTFSYGFLIPFIAAYFVWDRRRELKAAPIRANLGAVVPLFFAVMAALAGLVLGETFTARVSMILALGSSIYLLGGRRLFQVLLFPVCYLALMIPLPYVLTKEVAYQLRFFDASLAASVLQLVGIPVYRENYFLHLPNISLEVADVCAGLASIFSLFALGGFYVYFLPLVTRMKVVLMLSTFPIAVFANLIRIIVVSVLAYVVGPVTLDMLYHRFSGTTTFLMALIFLVALGELLRKRWPAQSPGGAADNASSSDFSAGTATDWKPFICGAVIFVCALSISALLNSGRAAALAGPGFNGVPRALGVFAAADVNWQDRYEDPKADSSTSRIYFGPDQAPIEVFSGYKSRQDGQDRLQSPKLILGERWNFAWVSPARLDMPTSRTVDGNWMLARNGNNTRLVLYWYQFGQTTVAGELDYRINLVKRLIFERRSDGTVVRLATPVDANEPLERAQKRLTALARELYPQLLNVLPE